MDVDHDNIPPYFLCPISLEIMKDPVTVSSGISYDRSSIARWLSHRRSCPVTNQPLSDLTLTPNTTLLNLINSWAHKSNPHSSMITSLHLAEYSTDAVETLIFKSVSVLKDRNSNLKEAMAALSVLVEVLPRGRNRASAVEAGVVAAVVELLVEESGDRRRYSEAMLVVLELLCRKAEGRSALAGHPAGIAAVAGKVLRVSPGATERAVRVLGLLCRNVCGGEVVEEMVAVGGVAKLCMVVQVEGSSRVREMAKRILGLHMKIWRKSPCFLHYCLN